MSELGQLLKKARLEKGISLDDLQDTTKIRKRYLEAIENGEYNVLPGNFYVRAFIKSYAEAVGLDPDEVLAMYKNVIPASVVPEAQIETMARSRRSNVSDRTGKLTSTILVIFFPILILAVIYYFAYSSDDNKSKDTPTDKEPITQGKPTPSKNTGQQKPENTDNNTTNNSEVDGQNNAGTATDPVPTEPVPALTLLKTERRTDYYSLSQAQSIKVEIKLTGDKCWFEVRKDNSRGEQLTQGNLDADHPTYSTELTQGVYLNFGRGNAVQLTVNGNPVDLGAAANQHKVQIDLTQS